MEPSLNYDPMNLVTLTRATFAMSWDVPYDVAVHWDQEYEVTRARVIAKLWGKAHCFAVGDVRVALSPIFLATTDRNGRKWVEAHASWYGFSLSELPEGQREAAQQICESSMRQLYISFIKLEPLMVASLEG